MLHPSAFSSASTVQFVDNEVASAFGGLQSYNQSSGFQHFQQQQQQQQQYNQQQQHHFHRAQVDQQQNGPPDVFEGFADIPSDCAMKVKELEVTANVAWSPAALEQVHLAAGTAAQQLDATFSTSSALEIYSLDLSESGHQMPKACSVPVDHRYHKLIWGPGGVAEGARPSGILAGGLDQGVLTLYDADKLLRGATEDAVLSSRDKHTGAVQALDFNPFQANLLASGASESEVYIWDVNKPSAPMTPGAKSQPADDVRCVAWNRQVQHILATTFSTRCVVWDLRKNDPIIKVSDSTSRMRTKVVAWHPEVATQLCLASEDDHTPVIQIWDLRLASSPIRTLENHTRGVLSVAWCQQDPDLLLSCGKDNRILCWNPNSVDAPNGEVLCELATSGQWSFDVSWCPRNPAVIAASSFDGRVSVYSLLGGQAQSAADLSAAAAASSNIADSFPGMEAMRPVSVSPGQQASQAQAASAQQLRKPPKWLRRPCGASFGFGGKLVTFGTVKPPANQQASQGQQQQGQQQAQPTSEVTLCKVVTEPELVERSLRLETSIQNQNLPEFCESKVASSSSSDDEQLWRFVGANFADNPRLRFLDLLGFNSEAVAEKIEAACGVTAPEEGELMAEDGRGASASRSVDEVAATLANDLNTTDDKEGAFEAIASKQQEKLDKEEVLTEFRLSTGDDRVGQLNRALLTGNISLAVELCVEARRWADALALASTRGGDALARRTIKKYLADCAEAGADEANLIRALAVGGSGQDGGGVGGWRDFARRCAGEDWRQALAAAATYAGAEEFPEICAELGDRRAADGDGQGALICYICAGDLERLVAAWLKQKDVDAGPKALQDMVEVVMSLKSAVERFSGEIPLPESGDLSQRLSQYARLLAAQGALTAALTYLGPGSGQEQQQQQGEVGLLRDRLAGAIGQAARRQKHSVGRTSSSQGGRAQHQSGGGSRIAALRRQSRSVSQCSDDSVFAMSADSSMLQGRRKSSVHQQHYQQQHQATPPPMFQPPSAAAAPLPTGPFVAPAQAVPQQIYTPAPPASNYDFSSSGGFGAAVQPSSQPNIMVPAAPSAAAPPPVAPPPTAGGGAANPAVSDGPGWNDPPPMPSTTVKSRLPHSTKTVPSSTAAGAAVSSSEQEPITQPLLGGGGVGPTDPLAPPPIGGGYAGMGGDAASYGMSGFGGQPPQQTYGAGGYQQDSAGYGMAAPPQQPPANFMQPAPAQFMTPAPVQTQPQSVMQPTQQPQQPPANFGRSRAAPAPVEKGPIPAEHLVLQEVFDGLRNKCVAAANHPQTRRKLDDVGKKLEILYDKLREGSLSSPMTSSLHDLVSHLSAGDYATASAAYAAVVSGPCFAEAAAFMPALKVLMTQGQQLGVVP